MSTQLFFLFLLLIIPFTLADAALGGVILEPGQAGGDSNGEIVLDNDSTVDLSLNVVTVTETTKTIGGEEVSLTQQTEFIATAGEVVTLINTDLKSVQVEIPDRAIVSANATWDKTITPPKTVGFAGEVPSGFQTPTTSILVGSPDVILVFDKAVTIIIQDSTGQTAYKLPNTDEWILIPFCSGTFENPTDPAVNKECSIDDGKDTKILTYHFTEFSGFSSTPSTPSAPAETPSTGSSGGSGNTGVGSPRIFGPGSSGSSSGGGTYYGPSDSGPRVFPAWFDMVKDWYREGKIGAADFLNAYQWIMTNIIK